MKKLCFIALAALLLTGCAEPEAFETMSDVYYEPQQPQALSVSLTLPEEAAVTVMENESTGSIYLCDGYCVMVQTMAAGDLDATLRSVTGFSREDLPVMELRDGENLRYECVWASAGEGGDQVGRAVVVDDGNYHYTVSILADAQTAGTLTDTWQQILSSFSLAEDGTQQE